MKVEVVGADENSMLGVVGASSSALMEYIILIEQTLLATKAPLKTYQTCQFKRIRLKDWQENIKPVIASRYMTIGKASLTTKKMRLPEALKKLVNRSSNYLDAQNKLYEYD